MSGFTGLPTGLKRKLLRYAKGVAPYDKGNLALNAIKGNFWTDPNRFRIKYSIADAFYITYLEEGEFAGGSDTKPNKHRAFIFKTYLAIAGMLNGYLNEGRDISGIKSLRNTFKDTNDLERSLRHIRSLEENGRVKETKREYFSATIGFDEGSNRYVDS